MSLPKAVQQIGDAAEAAAVKAGIKPGGQPAPGEQQPAVAVVADPAPGGQKVDPDNYKERYSRYKATTDETISELRQTLAQTQATLADVQRQNQELITKLNTAPQPAAADPASPAEPDTDAAYKAWLDKLPQKIKDDYTEDYLRDQFIIQTSAAGQRDNASPDNLSDLESRVNHIEQVAVKTEAQLYEEAMDEAYPDDAWITMTHDKKWGEFCAQKVSPVDQRTYGEIVKQGNETHTAQTVIWVLRQFEQYQSNLNDGGSAQPNPLESQLTPEDGGDGGDPITEINAQAETFTVTQVNQFFTDVATTKKYTAEQAKAIEDSILKAQAAGKIIQG